MKSPLAIMTVYSVASRLPSLRSALRGLDTTSVHGHLESWATARKPPAGALARKVVKTQTCYSWCPRNRGNSEMMIPFGSSFSECCPPQSYVPANPGGKVTSTRQRVLARARTEAGNEGCIGARRNKVNY